MKRLVQLLLLCVLMALLVLSVSAADISEEVDIQEDMAKTAAEEWLRLYTAKVFLYYDSDLTCGTVAALPAAQRNALTFDPLAYQFQTEAARYMNLTTAADSIDYLLEKADYLSQMRQMQDITRENFEVTYIFKNVQIVGNSASLSVEEDKSFYYTGCAQKTYIAEIFDVYLIRVNGQWLVYDVTVDDSFDTAYKWNTTFSAEAELAKLAQAIHASPGEPTSFHEEPAEGESLMSTTGVAPAAASLGNTLTRSHSKVML